ncbi:MAG: hypothetical protein AAF558_01345 [Verrucomicrobiota bacterium]
MQFVDLGGRSAQRLGLSRSLGQIYAALYLSPRPLGLEDLMTQLHISKGNASMGVRQLAEWGAIKRVWIKGSRKDFYQAEENLRTVVSQFIGSTIRPRIKSSHLQLEDMTTELKSKGKPDPDEQFMQDRIQTLQRVHKRLEKVIPLIEKVLS